MLFEIDRHAKHAVRAPASSFAQLGVQERYDLQEWVLACPGLLGEELLIITSEFDRFDRTSERLDVLALDEDGRLVVIELKRSAAGTHAELQAVRYAAYCSDWTFDDVVTELTQFRRRRGDAAFGVEQAKEVIRDFASGLNEGTLDGRPRIILAAAQFSPEIISTVLWLRGFLIDVTCVELVPHLVGDRLVIESSVLVPLPNARDLIIQKERRGAETAAKAASQRTWDDYVATLDPRYRELANGMRQWMLSQDDVGERVWNTWVGYRSMSDRAWFSWLGQSAGVPYLGLPPELEIPSGMTAKKLKYGWSNVSFTTAVEADKLRVLLISPARIRRPVLSSGAAAEGA